MSNSFYGKLELNPVIAAASSIEKLEEALKSPCEIIFLLTGSIFNLKNLVERCKEKSKSVYIHIDLLDGFSRDIVAMRYISENIKPDGIITTKSNLIKPAKELGLFVIQRLFMLDSLSLETGIKIISNTKPNAIEIMPGIMPKVTKILTKETKIPVITGGLIIDKEDVIQSLKVGAVGISTSKEDIWYM
ncbi:glycerol-3-phosphate responsive antiterminator [Clostridiaceae bacterium M8S5]|nr:glycerol-3-phosphate responsive antiterminator [Clostridiaceae bacterium M8S5]